MKNCGVSEERMEKDEPVKPDNPEQSRRFEKTARELVVDDAGEKFSDVLKNLLPAKRDAEPPVNA